MCFYLRAVGELGVARTAQLFGLTELTAEVAEFFAEVAEENPSPAFLCEILGVLCVLGKH